MLVKFLSKSYSVLCGGGGGGGGEGGEGVEGFIILEV